MSDHETVLERLRADPGPLDDLAGLLADDLLDRPLADLVSAAQVAEAVAGALASLAADEALEERLREHLERGAEAAEEAEDAPAERIPEEALDAPRRLLGRPWSPDSELVQALLDHDAVRGLVREVLQDALLEFGRTLRSFVPDAPRPRRGRLAALVEKAQGVASVLSAEVERKLEGRVRTFVEGAIGRALEHSTSYLSGTREAESLAAWRVHALDVLAGWPRERWADGLRRLDEEGLVDELADVLRDLAAWEGLTGWLEEVLTDALAAPEGGTLAEILPGEREEWRTRLAAPLRERTRAVVATDAFAAWLSELLD